MDEMNETLDIEELFEILSNTTRRKILQLLASEALYPFQISRILDISPRIIGKYIAELEELGLVQTDERASDKGPSRKYAKLSKSFSIMVDVSPNNFSWKVVPIQEVTEELEIPHLITEDKKIGSEKIEKLRKLKESVKTKANQVKEIDNKRKQLVHDINECFSQFNDLIEDIVKDYSNRVILRALFKEIMRQQQDWISLTDLARALRVWRDEVSERLVILAKDTGIVRYKKTQGDIWFSI